MFTYIMLYKAFPVVNHKLSRCQLSDYNHDTKAHNSLLYKQSLDHVFVYILSKREYQVKKIVVVNTRNCFFFVFIAYKKINGIQILIKKIFMYIKLYWYQTNSQQKPYLTSALLQYMFVRPKMRSPSTPFTLVFVSPGSIRPRSVRLISIQN